MDNNTDPLFKLNMDEDEKKKAIHTLRCFLTLRAYDIISNGQYKKHVVQNKEICEHWAVQLYMQYQQTLCCLRNVTQVQAQIRAFGYDRLASLCNIVSECNEYPFTTNSTWSVCYLTGVRCKYSLQLKRNQSVFTSTKRAKLSTSIQMSTIPSSITTDNIDIHSKFRVFLVSYWLLSRFDTVLKVLVRQWMHQLNEKDCTDYSLLCRKFSADVVFQDSIVDLFFHSWVHVQQSVHMLISSKV
jgi:hypothetical protein